MNIGTGIAFLVIKYRMSKCCFIFYIIPLKPWNTGKDSSNQLWCHNGSSTKKTLWNNLLDPDLNPFKNWQTRKKLYPRNLKVHRWGKTETKRISSHLKKEKNRHIYLKKKMRVKMPRITSKWAWFWLMGNESFLTL